MPRAFVTGGAGYVGSELTRLLLDEGYEVLVFDDWSVGSTERLPMDNPNLHIQTGSVCDIQTLKNSLVRFKPTVVFHMAAIHYIPHCIKNPEQTKAINVTGTENLVAILLQLSSQPMLVLTSSASVYGASTPVPQRTNYTRRPCDIYGESKMLAEDIVISQYTNYIIARLFNVYGNSDPTPHLIPSITRQLSKSTIELGNPDSARDFIHVEDAARAFLALALRGTTQKVYNIGTGTSYSVRQVTRHIRRASNSKARFVFHKTERRPTDPRTLCADITAIVSDTGWQPSKSFDEGIITTLPSPRLISKSIHS